MLSRTHVMHAWIVAAVVFALLAMPSIAAAASCGSNDPAAIEWTGADPDDDLWTSVDNWEGAAVPGPTDNVCFPLDLPASVDLGVVVDSVASVTVTSGNDITFAAGSALSLSSADLTIQTGSVVRMAGSFMTDVIQSGTGTLSVEGASALDPGAGLTIGTGATARIATVDLALDGASDISVSGTLELGAAGIVDAGAHTGAVTVNSGGSLRGINSTGPSVSTARLSNSGTVSTGTDHSMRFTQVDNYNDADDSLTGGSWDVLAGGVLRLPVTTGLRKLVGASLSLAGAGSQLLQDDADWLFDNATGALDVNSASSITLSATTGHTLVLPDALLLSGDLTLTNGGGIQVLGVGQSEVSSSGALSVTGTTADFSALGASLTSAGSVTVGGEDSILTIADDYSSTAGTTTVASLGELRAGSVTLSGGDLTVDGSVVAPTTVNSGSLVTGDGGQFDSLDMAGGTISPGPSPALLSVSGAADFGSAATIELEVDGPLVVQTDRIVASGAVTLDAPTLKILTADMPAPAYNVAVPLIVGSTLTLQSPLTAFTVQPALTAPRTYATTTSATTLGVEVTEAVPPSGPAGSSSHTNVANTDTTVDIPVTGSSDPASGLAGWAVTWDSLPTTDPGTSVTHPFVDLTRIITSPSLSEGVSYAHIRTIDNEGNSTLLHYGPFTIDTTAPTLAAASTSHTAGTASVDPTIDLNFSGSADTNGVAGYAVLLTQSPTDSPSPTPSTASALFTAAPVSDGTWYAHVRAIDSAGLLSTALHLGPFEIDTTGPTNSATSSSHATGALSANSVISLNLGDETDPHGVAGHAISFTQGALDDPGSTAITTAASYASAPLADGAWYAHVRAVDMLGNGSAALHLGPFVISVNGPATPKMTNLPVINLTEVKKRPRLTASWRAVDTASAYQVLRSVTPAANKSAGGFSTAQRSAATTWTLTKPLPGATYCIRIAAIDALGRSSVPSAPRCTTIPVDDRALRATKEFIRTTSKSAYLGTRSIASAEGALLTLPKVGARSITLIAAKCSKCGTVEVRLGGKLLKRVSLKAKRTSARALIPIKTYKQRTGPQPLEVKVISDGAPVQIDGLVILA